MNPTRPLLGCIADDFTGATDLANMLVRGGMRTVQVIGVPAADAQIEACDALVVALKSRTTPAAEAVEQSLAALAWLRARGCRQIFFKYCSTFDSTAQGNIGPVTEALQEALDCDFALACPAFPETGRTLFRGHLFVQDDLLSDSGMRHHPLTPMTDANLVRVLQAQSRGRVGLIRYDQVAQGPQAVSQAIAALRASGHRLAIADALSDADLHTLGTACAEAPLLTGGSGLAQGLPANFRRLGLLAEHDAATLELPAGPGAVLAGSASQATNGQVAAWREAGRPALCLDPLALAQGDSSIDHALAWAGAQGQPVLIYATRPAEEVAAIQRELGVARVGELVERALGLIAQKLFDQGVRRLVVAGGETSGAVVQALGVRSLRIGAQIDPGVPVTLGTVQGQPVALALKSGNFGRRDFFAKALRHLAGDWT